ncbi:MAG TPA: carboxypeptidase-like regulatory domain-containing protein, partial [Candidatus Limnocylindrales bacterium]|nr:carboxypeptidase-like regulatory domain-containing protein [Candidatus Limnocylindrales bacterium]
MFLKRQPKFLPEVRGCESLTRIGSAFRRLPGWLVLPGTAVVSSGQQTPDAAVILKSAKRWQSRLKALALGLAVLVGTGMSVAAQSTSGSLSGTVKDAKGASIAGAAVEVTGTSRNETRTAQTGEDGRYVFPQLQPDTYKVRVEARGFKRYDLEGLVLSPNDKISAPDIQLEIGAVSENVSVISSGEQLQTESAERSTAITSDQVQNIPVNGRSYLSLTRL